MMTVGKMSGDGRWLAFYNCGEFSGARFSSSSSWLMCSQQHKHVQFIPLPPREEFTPFPDILHEQNLQSNKQLPFQHYVASLTHGSTPETWLDAYNNLLATLREHNPQRKLSYNFAMTTDWIFVAPRKNDDYQHEGYKIGVNSTGMVGLLLTKSDEETAFIEKVGPLAVLEDVGCPWPSNNTS
jgi:ATP adenylyltransferase